MYDDGYNYDHAACCGAGSQHHGNYERELLRWHDRFCYRDGYRWHDTLYV